MIHGRSDREGDRNEPPLIRANQTDNMFWFNLWSLFLTSLAEEFSLALLKIQRLHSELNIFEQGQNQS